MNNLALRIVTAIFGVAAIISAVILSPWSFAAVFAIIMLLSLKEFYGLAKATGRNPYEVWGLGFSLILFSLVFCYFEFDLSARLFWLLPALFAAVFIYPLQSIKTSHAINCTAISTLGVVCISLPITLINCKG